MIIIIIYIFEVYLKAKRWKGVLVEVSLPALPARVTGVTLIFSAL